MKNIKEITENLANKYDMRIHFIMDAIEKDSSLTLSEKLAVAFTIGKLV